MYKIYVLDPFYLCFPISKCEVIFVSLNIAEKAKKNAKVRFYHFAKVTKKS